MNRTPTEVEMEEPLRQLLLRLPWSSWDDAELSGVLRYVRGAKGLEIPEAFRACFPREA